jgi:hypothetical protein
MEYDLSQHARDVLEKRQIPRAWIERTMRCPQASKADPLDPDLTHYLARIDEFDDRVLKVIVNTKKTPPLVVTAFFDRGRTIP